MTGGNRKTLNINRRTQDAFYRYKMQGVQTKVESGRTTITNLEEIGRALRREPGHILRYLGVTLGCSTKVVETKYTVAGAFDETKLQGAIYDFIDQFVLCKECGNPETKFVVEKEGLSRACSSCGATVVQADHKISSTIIREIGSERFVDRNYEKELNKNAGKSFDELFVGMGYKEMNDYKDEFAKKTIDQILINIENMLETEEREESTRKYLKEVIKMGYGIDEIEEYFSRPKRDKKRNGLIKKGAKKFVESFEN
ncbi:IF5 [Enterospora canceri]|uniref:IF5 n=1 Tax=Enterospora canceri TaxID=1081671 RepID=A0A1Y1S8A1_9MICR|nr:IF5 [Enterospora canceri]